MRLNMFAKLEKEFLYVTDKKSIILAFMTRESASFTEDRKTRGSP